MKAILSLKRIFCGILAIAFVVSLALFMGSSVQADDEIPEYSLQISPIRFVMDLEPGDTYTDTFEVQNTGNTAYTYEIGVTPYTVTDENYTIDYDTATEYNSIVDWITFSKTSGSVEPMTNDEITVTINVPDDVPAGGQYAIIYAQITNRDQLSDTGMTINQRVGIKVYANIEGETREEGGVLENKIPSILFNPPVIATSLVENTGNVHAKATYVLQVYPLFSDEEVYTNEENPTELYILPETQRFNSISWDGAPQLGIFRVKQTVTIFDETSVTEKIVFLCPIWFLFLILLIIFFVIFWLVSRARSRKSTSKHVAKTTDTKE